MKKVAVTMRGSDFLSCTSMPSKGPVDLSLGGNDILVDSYSNRKM